MIIFFALHPEVQLMSGNNIFPLEPWAELLLKIIFYTVDARVQLIDLAIHDNINCPA